jgi:hypothetical protein
MQGGHVWLQEHFWSKLSRTTFDRFTAIGGLGGLAFDATAQAWAQKHNFNMDHYIKDGAFFLDVVLTVPVPHAVLITSSVWSSYAVPIRDAQGHKIKFFELVKPLMQAIGDPTEDDENILGGPFGPDDFHMVSDSIRQLLTFVPHHAILLRTESAHLINRIDRIRKDLLAQQFSSKQRCFSIEFLLNCVCLSGLLKRAEYTQQVILRALKIAVPDKGQLQHLESVINNSRLIPSAATLVRNRLTVHLGYCVWKQGQLAELLNDPMGSVGWITMDLSPRIGYEWLLDARTDMRVSDLDRALALALELGTSSRDRDLELDKELRGIAINTIGVPTGVGSGRQTTRHKVQSFVHGTRLTTQSWKAACAFASRAFTVVGDLGESGICKFRQDTRQLIGPWIENDDNSDDEEGAAHFDFAEDDQKLARPHCGVAAPLEDDLFIPEGRLPDGALPLDDDPNYVIEMRRMVYFGGPHHMLQGFIDGVPAALAVWNWFIILLKHICRLISNKWSKHRMLQTCFRDPPLVYFTPEIMGFNQHVYDKRWGTAAAASVTVGYILESVRLGWDKHRYLAGGGHAPAEDGDGDRGDDDHVGRQANLDRADEAITSVRFKAYIIMMEIAGFLIMALSAWFDDCPCHGKEPGIETASDRRQRKQYYKRARLFKCFMAGRRAANMAAGEVLEFIRRLFATGQNALAMELARERIDDGNVAFIVREFAALRRHALFFFSLKFSYLRQLPWIIFGIAHRCLETAIACLKRGMDLFDAWYAAGPSEVKQHWLAVVMYWPGSRGRADSITFILTGAASTFLGRIRGRCIFPLTTDRYVEALHAGSRQSLISAPHAGAVHVAFFAAAQGIEEAFEYDPVSALGGLADACSEARNVLKGLKKCGLIRHPGVIKYFAGNPRRQIHYEGRKGMIEIIYHLDRPTLYGDVPEALIGFDGFDAPPPGPPPSPIEPPPEDEYEADGDDADDDDDQGDGGDGPPGDGNVDDPFAGVDDGPLAPSDGGPSGGGAGRGGGRTRGGASRGGVDRAPSAPGGSSASGHGTSGGAPAGGCGGDDGGGGEGDDAKNYFGVGGDVDLGADGGSSVIHDAIWCKYALRQLKTVASEDNDGLGRATYCLTTTLPIETLLLNSKRFLDVVAPNPEARSDALASEGFDFSSMDNLRAARDKSVASTLPSDGKSFDRRLFFKTVGMNPSQAKVVPGAPKANDWDSIVVCLSSMQSFNKEGKLARCYIREEDDDADRMFVITPSSFSMDEWKSLKSFHPQGMLHYSFEVPMAEELEQVGSNLLRILMRSDFVWNSSTEGSQDQLKYLKVLEGHNYVSRAAGADSWRLTACGYSSFVQSETLMPTRRVMRPLLDTRLVDCTTLELHYLLEKANWICEFPPFKTKSKSLLEYSRGGPKIWYLARKAQAFSHNYFLALLKYKLHKSPVEPFRSASYYKDMIDGRVVAAAAGSSKKRKTTTGFDYGAEEHPDTVKEREKTEREAKKKASKHGPGQRQVRGVKSFEPPEVDATVEAEGEGGDSTESEDLDNEEASAAESQVPTLEGSSNHGSGSNLGSSEECVSEEVHELPDVPSVDSALPQGTTSL